MYRSRDFLELNCFEADVTRECSGELQESALLVQLYNTRFKCVLY